MAKFRTGLELEDRLKTILERIGCSITEDTELDHAWKIDFVVTRFPQIPSVFAMGVQVTARPDDLPKLEEFHRIHQYNRIAEKIMYLEFDKYADLDKGGGMAAFAAMLDYRLNTYWRNTPIIGIRVNNDLSITTFNLQERISELRRKQSHPHHPQSPANRMSAPRPEHPRTPPGNQTAPVPAALPQSSPSSPAPEPIIIQAEAPPERVKPVAQPVKPPEAEASAPAPEKKPRRRRSRSS
jgi:hypothetical protein